MLMGKYTSYVIAITYCLLTGAYYGQYFAQTIRTTDVSSYFKLRQISVL